MPLPPEVALRRVAGRVFYDDGESVSGGRITFTMPAPVFYRAPNSSASPSRVLLPRTHSATVGDDGYLELPQGLIPWDDPNIDAGNGGKPWAYEVRRTWGDRKVVAYVVVTKGTAGTTADDPLDITDLIVPAAPNNVAIVVGPPGKDGIASITDGSITAAKLAPTVQATIDSAAPLASPAFTGTPTLNGQPFPSGGSGSDGAVDGGDFDTTPAATLDGGSF